MGGTKVYGTTVVVWNNCLFYFMFNIFVFAGW